MTCLRFESHVLIHMSTPFLRFWIPYATSHHKIHITYPKAQKQGGRLTRVKKYARKVWAAILTLSGMCSIFVNIVNHRLADGSVNCTCGNNMTQRMLLFTAFRWHFRTGRVRRKNRKALPVTLRGCFWMTLQKVVIRPFSNLTPHVLL